MKERVKLSDQEISEIQELQKQLFRIVTAVGEAQLNKMNLEAQLEEVNAIISAEALGFKDYTDLEAKFSASLVAKYGSGNVDLETWEVLK